MENKALRITVGLTPEERDFLNLLQHKDAAANLSQAVAWCIDSCMKIEKLYGIDACYVAYNDIRKPENDPTLEQAIPFPTLSGHRGEEELDWLESFNREEVKNILMEFSYDFQQEKYGGCSTHRHIVSLFIKAHRELFSTPTPPAGEERAADRMTEGEGEIPFDVCTDIYNMWVEDKGGFFFPPYQAGAIAMWRKMQDEAIAKDKIISGLRERLRIIISNSEEFGSDYANCRQELSAAQSRIVELEKQLAEDDIWDAVRKYRDAHPEPQEDESWERRKIDRLCDVIGISEDQIRELEDEVKAQKAKQRELVAELQKQLAEEKSFHANWRAIADQYEADKKELEAKVQLRNDQMVTSSNRIEGLIEQLAMVRQFRDNIAADKEALEVRVKQLQEWHDSHC